MLPYLASPSATADAIRDAGRCRSRRTICLARAQSILAALTEAEAEASARASEGPRGTLRLALPGSFGRLWVAPFLPEFLAAHPQVRIDAEFSNRFVDLVGEGFDAAVRLGELPDSSLIARKIATPAAPALRRANLPRAPWRSGAARRPHRPCLSELQRFCHLSGLALHERSRPAQIGPRQWASGLG